MCKPGWLFEQSPRKFHEECLQSFILFHALNKIGRKRLNVKRRSGTHQQDITRTVAWSSRASLSTTETDGPRRLIDAPTCNIHGRRQVERDPLTLVNTFWATKNLLRIVDRLSLPKSSEFFWEGRSHRVGTFVENPFATASRSVRPTFSHNTIKNLSKFLEMISLTLIKPVNKSSQ